MTLVSQLAKSVNNDTKDDIDEQNIDNDKENKWKYIHCPIVRICYADCIESVSNSSSTSESIVESGNESLEEIIGIIASTACTFHIVLVKVDETEDTE